MSNQLPQRTLKLWLEHYSNDHQHPINILIHWVCVPIIVWSAIAALWAVPVPIALGKPGCWAGVSMFLALMFYLRLSRRLMFGMLGVFIVFGLITAAIYQSWGATRLLWLAAVLFGIAWIGQFIGHYLEGKRPSFFTDMVYLLIGPAWLLVKCMRRLGLHPDAGDTDQKTN